MASFLHLPLLYIYNNLTHLLHSCIPCLAPWRNTSPSQSPSPSQVNLSRYTYLGCDTVGSSPSFLVGIKMKKKASLLLKQVVAALTAVVKSKTLALKTKTSAVKTRLAIFGLLHNKWTAGGAIAHKIHSFVGAHHQNSKGPQGAAAATPLVGYGAPPRDVDDGRAIPMWDDDRPHTGSDDYNDDDGYPDLRHSLFEEEEDDDDCTGSVIELVRKGREEETDFSLEDEIDRVADVFIRRFHRQMRLQKQESLKRYKDMLDRSV